MNVQNARPDPRGPSFPPPDGDRIIAKRVMAQVEGNFVVFLIGMRINSPLKPHKWLPVFLAMRGMLKELDAQPESGLLAWRYVGGRTFIQYWRSFDHLEAYAHDRERSHWPAWVAFNRRMAQSRADVGIWHETYCVRAGEYEAIYRNMPVFGLGKAGQVVDAVGSGEGARQRLQAGGEASGAKPGTY